MLQKQKRVSAGIFGIVVALAAISPAFSASAEFDRGVKAFKAKQFSAAAKQLGTAVQRQEKNNALAHYYLGSALLSLQKTDDALNELRTAYYLDPRGTAGKYSAQTLSRFGKDAFKQPVLANADTASGDQLDSLKGTAKNKKECCAKDKACKADPMCDANASEVPQINIDKSALPAVPSFEHGPYLSMVKRWDYLAQADYVRSGEAQALTQKAQTQLAEARKILNQADSYLRIYVPTKRNKMESAAAFQMRYEAAKDQVSSALQPYQAAVKQQELALKDAQEIQQICLSSSKAQPKE